MISIMAAKLVFFFVFPFMLCQNIIVFYYFCKRIMLDEHYKRNNNHTLL